MKIKEITLEAYLVTASIICGLLYQVMNTNTLLKALSLVFGAVAIVLYIIFAGRINSIFKYWLGLCVYMVLVGLISASSWPEHIYTFFRLDLSTMILAAEGLMLADERFDECRFKIIKVVLLIALIAGIVALTKYSGNASMLIDRSASIKENSISYVLWGVCCNIFAYAGFSAIFSPKWRIAKITIVVLYLLLGIMFQKRSVIVNIAVMLVIAFFAYQSGSNLNKNIFKRSLTITAVLCLIFLIGLIVYNRVESIRILLDNTLGRLTNVDIDNYDRGREAYRLLESSSWMGKIYGYGVGHYFRDVYGIHGMIHLGYINALYKGGALYLLFIVYIVTKTIGSLWRVSYLDPYSRTCLCVTLSAFASMAFELSWGETILMFCYMPFIGHICLLDKRPHQMTSEF